MLDVGTYEKLIICQAILQNKFRKKISLDKTIDFLIENYKRDKHARI